MSPALDRQSARQSTLASLFSRQARLSSSRVALTCGHEHLTYSELESRVDLLGRRLRRLGVRRNTLVAVAVDRSIDQIVSLLAVHRAGGAYVPLDPRQPRKRHEAILAEANAALVITTQQGAESLPAGLPQLVLDVQEEDFGVSFGGEWNESEDARTDDLAYVLFTSGSTGVPKGIAVEHQHVVWLLDATAPLFSPGPDDVRTMFHSFTFDVSVWEVFGALLSGSRLVLVSHEVARQPNALLSLLEREHVTVLCQTPSAFWPLAEIDDGRELALKKIVLAGERLDVSRLATWFARRGDASPRLINMYGPTETTVYCTYGELSRRDLESPSRSPIGRPLPEVHARVVDELGADAPDGVEGELWIGGPCVARGYFGRSDLTRERFLAIDSAGPGSAARWYRTGDRVIRSSDGTLDFVGREDGQVKLRGFRIELGEIEATLRTTEGIQDAVVLLLGRDTAAHLSAYLVAGPSDVDRPEPIVARARFRAISTLPDYMCPTEYVVLDRLPLTASGKLDRKALEARRSRRSSAPYRPPTTPTEARLAEFWSELLNLSPVGRDDDFFELGGHSIAAMELGFRISQSFGTAFSVQDVYGSSDLKSLAQAIDTRPQSAELGPIIGRKIRRPTERTD